MPSGASRGAHQVQFAHAFRSLINYKPAANTHLHCCEKETGRQVLLKTKDGLTIVLALNPSFRFTEPFQAPWYFMCWPFKTKRRLKTKRFILPTLRKAPVSGLADEA